MADKSKKGAPLLPKKVLTPRQIERCIERLDQRIAELEKFDISSIRSSTNAELTALSAAIRDTLDRCFGEGSGAFNRFETATILLWSPSFSTGSYPQAQHYQEGVQKHIQRAIALLVEAKRSLLEDLEDASIEAVDSTARPSSSNSRTSSKVFVVHGHDEAALHSLARFLEKLELEAIILREQPNEGKTIIEKFEAYAAQVAFAVVLLTPDDVGGAKAAKEPQARTRQNVIYELGYFVGTLGRGKTCLLRKGETEIPSDLEGIVYTDLDNGGAWKYMLAREFKAAGLKFDPGKIL
jgi:predicted nucleotide-binding protein